MSVATSTAALGDARSAPLGLSEEQRCVVRWCASSICVVTALAGSGKTRVAIEWIIAWGCKLNNKVLAISFTRRGAAELRARLTGVEELDGRVIASTFDSLLLVALRTLGLIPAGLCKRASVHQEVDALYEHVGTLLAALSHEVWPSNARQWIREVVDKIARGQDLAPEVAAVVGPLWEIARRQLEGGGLMACDTYKMLLTRHCSELARYLYEELGIGAIVVDECQDNSAAELAIVCALQRIGPLPLLLLGDRNQSVNAFRGAVGDVSAYLDAQGLDYAELQLTCNYRSSAALVACQNSLRTAGDHGEPLARAIAAGGFPALQLVVGTEELLVDAIARVLELVGIETEMLACPSRVLPRPAEELLQGLALLRYRGIAPKDVRMLAPSNTVVHDIVSALSERGLPVAEAGTPKNPYESSWAAVTRAWCVPASGLRGSALTGAVCDVLRAHARPWTRGASALEREEMATTLGALCGRAISLAHDASFKELSADLLGLTGSLIGHDELFAERSQSHLVSVTELFTDWRASVASGEVDVCLEQLLVSIPEMRRRPTRRGESRADTVGDEGIEPRFLAAVRRVARRPGDVAGSIDELARSWRRPELDDANESDAVLAMTVHGSKALTIPVVVEAHGEQLPFARGPERSTGRWALSEVSLPYVSLSRAAEAFVSVCVGAPGRLHREPLEGWQYLFIDVEPPPGFRQRSICCVRS